MIAVLAVCVLGPFSAAYVLGPAALLLLPAVGGMLGVTLGLDVTPGAFTLPDEITGGGQGRRRCRQAARRAGKRGVAAWRAVGLLAQPLQHRRPPHRARACPPPAAT